MPASTYPKTHGFGSTFESSPLPLPRKKASVPPPTSAEPQAPATISAPAAHLLSKFIEAHRALDDYK